MPHYQALLLFDIANCFFFKYLRNAHKIELDFRYEFCLIYRQILSTTTHIEPKIWVVYAANSSHANSTFILFPLLMLAKKVESRQCGILFTVFSYTIRVQVGYSAKLLRFHLRHIR